MHDIQQRAFAEEGRRCETREIPPLTETIEEISEHIRHHTALVAKCDGVVVGTIRGLVADGVCTIRALAIDPAHQGRGMGASLLKALEVAHAQVAQFKLTTNTLMEGNVPFYERHGYRVVEFTRHSEKIVLAQMEKVPADR